MSKISARVAIETVTSRFSPLPLSRHQDGDLYTLPCIMHDAYLLSLGERPRLKMYRCHREAEFAYRRSKRQTTSQSKARLVEGREESPPPQRRRSPFSAPGKFEQLQYVRQNAGDSSAMTRDGLGRVPNKRLKEFDLVRQYDQPNHST